MNSAAAFPLPLAQTGWWEWLRRELAPFPGRGTATLRLVVTTALVVVISMTLQIPLALVSAYMVFFVTRENKVGTTLMGLLVIFGAAISLGVSLLLYRLTLDDPELRIPMMAVVLFTGFYLARVVSLGPLTFGMAFVIAGTQSLVETMPAEALVRWVLWLWVAASYPIALTILVNHFLLPAHPRTALIRELVHRLDRAAAIIAGKTGRPISGRLTRSAGYRPSSYDNTALFKLLTFAEMADPPLKRQHESQCAAILATDRLLTAADAFALRTGVSAEEDDRRVIESLLKKAALLRRALRRRSFKLLPEAEEEIETALPEIHELQRSLSMLYESLEGEAIERVEMERMMPHRKSLWATDAFTNPAHVAFALKVTLATMGAYLLYTAVDWPGVHTAFVTTCFIALENTGSTIRKGLLRIGGCLVGGLLGFLFILYVMPQLESIVSLVILVAAVSAMAGWVASGSERISYAGLQIALAFFMCVLQSFEPDTDLTRIRDRVAGILLGIIVTTVVFRYVWPEHASDQRRTRLLQALRGLARLVLLPGLETAPETGLNEAWRLRGAIKADLSEIIRLGESATFEDERDGADNEVTDALGIAAAELFLTATLLAGETGFAEWRRLSSEGREAESELRVAAAKRIERMAASLRDGTCCRDMELGIELAVCVSLSSSTQRSALLHRLVLQIRDLAGRINSSIPFSFSISRRENGKIPACVQP